MKNRFFALLLIGWHTGGLGMEADLGIADFSLPANEFYLLNNKRSPFVIFPDLKGTTLSTKDPRQARISFNMLRSLRAIRSFFEGVSKGWTSPIDTARTPPAYTDNQLDAISNELAKVAGIDPKEVAPLSIVRQAIYDKILPFIKDGMQMGFFYPMTNLMLLEAYFGSDEESQKIAALKKDLPVDVYGIDLDHMITEAREAQKLDLEALYRGFVDGAFMIKVENPSQYSEFLGSKRIKVFSMLGKGHTTGTEADIANHYGLPLIYADEGIATIKSRMISGSAPHTISKELIDSVALFNRFKSATKPANAAGGSLTSFSKDIETQIQKDIGSLLAQPKATPEKAKADQVFINAYLEGLLVHMVNKYVITDPAIDAKILNRWNTKDPVTTKSLTATSLYKTMSSGMLSTQLTDFGMALMVLSNHVS